MKDVKVAPGFGYRVLQSRNETGLSKVAFARKALSKGASAKNIGRIEYQEVVPRITTLEKVANFSGTNLDWLVTGQCNLEPNSVCHIPGIGKRIKAARLNQGLTRNALSRMAGLGNTTKNVDRLEKVEYRPCAKTLVKLSKVLKVSPVYLAFGA